MILDLWLIANITIGVALGSILTGLGLYAIVVYDDWHRQRLIDRELNGDSR